MFFVVFYFFHIFFLFFFSSRRRHTRSVSAFLLNRSSDLIRDASVFVGVLGASNYTFGYLCWGQSIPDFIDANNRMLQFFGGVTEFIVPDNLKSAVIVAGLKRLKLNQNYREWAVHNGTIVLPARVEKPKDKASAEVGVQIAQRHIVFRMRQQRWHSLEEANAALRVFLDKLNSRPFSKMPGTRRERYETIDKPALKELPATVFEPSEIVIRKKVGDEYHVEYGSNFYSVPYALAPISANSSCGPWHRPTSSNLLSLHSRRSRSMSDWA
eukprot:TRINITY_DN8826_c0_g1_i6.p1 TRINITY_DN8826_c0_g1~~TRINITY_DN8826_c0_g1_i6.p1  ORF type:complete len:269 (-),score=47.57 TRINITY_DN8826_c0_g1_i6:213-1019(-)